MRTRIFVLFAFLSAVAITSASAAQGARVDDARRGPFAGTIYTTSNATAGNAVLLFDRLPDGRLVPAGRVATGGAARARGSATRAASR